MTLTVLSDRDVSLILHSLTRDDVLHLQETLADALHWYSTSSDANDCGSDYQPDRIVTNRKDGSTSIYMPASGLACQGVKVINLSPLEHSDGTTSTIRGSITLLDANGNTTGLINAEEVTAFRTALASMILFTKRDSVHDMTVFGAGKQAYWHIRLAMLLRGAEIHHLNVITRNFDTARRCFERLYDPFPDDEVYDNSLCTIFDHPRFRTTILTPAHTEYPRLLKEAVRASHVLVTTTPSTTPLFPAKYLTNPGGRLRGRYIISIGSYKPHMIELHPDILRQAISAPSSSHSSSASSKPHHHHLFHFHQRRQREGGAIVVDTVTGALREAGEIIQAGLEPEQVVELGELFMLKRDAAEKPQGCHLADQSGLRDWLSKGNVIYKGVGLGMMDVVVGGELVRLAREKGIGTFIDDF
ncbi:NAD(P)-binding protein [Dissoconium aciculare CBS 342.82]|uniref:NAD(P)-binding protein n=1 Tax=Dissoconium aciculare CBS 342.82 TaxID=1314786 RepID=A0A6J3M515_9PEZI|nr:NAD(P)-binding protein [Dissoconium aciculare CBS 342.82]KAF1821972.1 NAD(P)-binding protein [Dissoconium aciculare CBS 342.82]